MSAKNFRSLFFCLLLLSTSSCITKSLWSDPTYQETISQFLVGADGRYVVLIGEEYHYVLTDNSGTFQKILSLKQSGVLDINSSKSHLKLDSNNDLKGYLVIEGPFSILPMEDVGMLTSMGIRPNKKDIVSIRVDLSGRRYSARYLGQALTKSNNTYTIPISYSDSGLVKGVGKAAITPITVGLDAVLLIGKIVVYPMTREGM